MGGRWLGLLGLALLAATGLLLFLRPSVREARPLVPATEPGAASGRGSPHAWAPSALDGRAAGPSRNEALGPNTTAPDTALRTGPDARSAEAIEFRLTARVVDDNGRPIVGATLEISDTSPPHVVDRTGPEGTIDRPIAWNRVLEGLVGQRFAIAPGRVELTVFADGFRGHELAIETRAGSRVDLGTIVLAPGARVHGFVLDSEGRHLAEADVRWADASDFPDDIESVRQRGFWSRNLPYRPRTVTGPDGAFQLRGIPPGDGLVLGHGRGTEWAWTAPFPLQANDVREVELVLPRVEALVELRGRVLDPTGRPVPDAEVVLVSNESEWSWRDAAPDGSFVFPTRPGRTYDVHAHSQSESHGPVKLEELSADATNVVVTLTEAAFLDVVLEDSSGARVAWGHVRGRLTHSNLFPTIPMTPTGEDGVARIPYPRGRFELSAFAPGYRTKTLVGQPDDLDSTLIVTLEPGQAVAGRVLHEGRPVGGAAIGIGRSFADGQFAHGRDVAPPDHPFHVLTTAPLGRTDATTDESGSFVATLHAAGWHTLLVEAEGFPLTRFGPWDFELENGVHALELELVRGGAIEGRVLFPPERQGKASFVAASNGSGIAWSTTVDEDGAFRFDELAPGDWQLRPTTSPISSPRTVTPWFPTHPLAGPMPYDCRVEAGQTVRCDLDRRTEGENILEGRIRFGDHDPSAWRARLLEGKATGGRRDRSLGSTAIDADGTFRLAVSQGGAYVLEIVGGAWSLYRPIELTPGTTRHDLVLETGSIRLAGPNPAARGVEAYRWLGPEGLVFSARVLTRKDAGGVLLQQVPAGPGAFVRMTLPEGGGSLDPGWESVLDADVPRGVELSIVVP